MTSTVTLDEPTTEPQTYAVAKTFRVRAIMKQGTAASLPAVWERYPTVEAARTAIRAMYHNDRVLRAFIVTDDTSPQFIGRALNAVQDARRRLSLRDCCGGRGGWRSRDFM
jgi:hypothetical protein